MQDKHNFSQSYLERKEAVLHALQREEAPREGRRISRSAIKILVFAAILYVLTVSVYAAVHWIDFRVEQGEARTHIHASLPETEKADKPLRSWNAGEGEISVRLNIPDLPADMREIENTNGKYYSEDTSRSMTVNGVDLRRSALDELFGGAVNVKRLDAGGKAMYVVSGNSEAAFYNRTAYIVFEEEELVLKLWVSYGIRDEELLAMASTLTLEETADPLLALPIINELNDGSYDPTTPEIVERDPVYASDLLEIGESVRGASDYYTATVNDVEVYDHINGLNPNCFLRGDFVKRFTDDAGNLVPYQRTEIIHAFTPEGKHVSTQFGESILSAKRLYVITLTMTDVTMDGIAEEDRERMLKACVNGFMLNGYTVNEGVIEIISSDSVVIARRPELYADSSESVYREYLGQNRWKVAYLIDETIAEEHLVLWEYSNKIYVKIR